MVGPKLSKKISDDRPNSESDSDIFGGPIFFTPIYPSSGHNAGEHVKEPSGCLQGPVLPVDEAFHPMFGLTWLEQHDATQVCSVKGTMESAIETALKELRDNATSVGSASEAEEEGGHFFRA